MTPEEQQILVECSKRVKEYFDMIIDGLLGDVSIAHNSVARLSSMGDIILECFVDPKYVGRVIGKQGKAADAVRELVKRNGKIIGRLNVQTYIFPIGGTSNGRTKTYDGDGEQG